MTIENISLYIRLSNVIFELCLLADQNPRKFFDQRDAGLYICRWPGSPPEDPFRHSSEVSGASHPNCVQFVPVSFSRCINFRLCNCFIFLSRNVKKEWRMCYEVLCQIWVFLSAVKRLLTLGHAHGMSRNSYSQRDDLAMQVTILSTLHIETNVCEDLFTNVSTCVTLTHS